MATCRHSGPYRAVQGVIGGDVTARCAVLCTGCGGFQHAAGGSFDPHVCEMMRADPRVSDRWSGTAVDPAVYPQDAALRLLSGPLASLVEAHKVAQQADRAAAALRRDGGYFIGACMVPPWQESKRDARSGDLLVRDRVGWTPAPFEPGDVHAGAAS
jgi:hypothetical protein